MLEWCIANCLEKNCSKEIEVIKKKKNQMKIVEMENIMPEINKKLDGQVQ